MVQFDRTRKGATKLQTPQILVYLSDRQKQAYVNVVHFCNTLFLSLFSCPIIPMDCYTLCEIMLCSHLLFLYKQKCDTETKQTEYCRQDYPGIPRHCFQPLCKGIPNHPKK